jgi:hypothetical protein
MGPQKHRGRSGDPIYAVQVKRIFKNQLAGAFPGGKREKKIFLQRGTVLLTEKKAAVV